MLKRLAQTAFIIAQGAARLLSGAVRWFRADKADCLRL